MDNKELDDHLYKYPESEVLRNKLDIKDPKALDIAEQELVSDRIVEGVPNGNFGLKHLKEIHKHLFQDVYEWAGELRQVAIVKGSSAFMAPNRIEFAMKDVEKRLESKNYLKGLSQEEFAKEAGEIIGDINHVHPFREGNGRTQLQYLKKLGEHAGHEVDLEKTDKTKWIQASIEANRANYSPMSECILEITSEKSRNNEHRKEAERERKIQEFLQKHTYNTGKDRDRDGGHDRDL